MDSIFSHRALQYLAGLYIDVAHDVGAMVVAEGISCMADLEWTILGKVDLAQAFLLSEPGEIGIDRVSEEIKGLLL
jgi:EAL domain-containing protein (putative c-di-GMP-specific phosphodiesterase class I)